MSREWTLTIQIPLIKTASSTSVDDYRRITLCSIGYKYYAHFVLMETETHVEDLPDHQTAFLRNRSADDHIYTIRSIMEEKWREDTKIVVATMNLKKAFDTVRHKEIPKILRKRGVPYFPMNRIIIACLHEETSVQWFRQTTAPF